MSVTTKITFNDSPSGQGDAPQVTGRISNMVITNNAGESIAYSTDSGDSFTTLANGSSATLGAGDPSSFRFRRVNSGGYPLAVDAVITMSMPMSDGWFDSNADGSTSLVGSDGSAISTLGNVITCGAGGQFATVQAAIDYVETLDAFTLFTPSANTWAITAWAQGSDIATTTGNATMPNSSYVSEMAFWATIPSLNGVLYPVDGPHSFDKMVFGMRRREATFAGNEAISFYLPNTYTILLLDNHISEAVTIDAPCNVVFRSLGGATWIGTLTTGNGMTHGSITFDGVTTYTGFLLMTPATNLVKLVYRNSQVEGINDIFTDGDWGSLLMIESVLKTNARVPTGHNILVKAAGDMSVINSRFMVHSGNIASADVRLFDYTECRRLRIEGTGMIVHDENGAMNACMMVAYTKNIQSVHVVDSFIDYYSPVSSSTELGFVYDDFSGVNQGTADVYLSELSVNRSYPFTGKNYAYKASVVGTTSDVVVNRCENLLTVAPSAGTLSFTDTQNVAYAAAITPDMGKGNKIIVGTLTGNITVNAPTDPRKGQALTFNYTSNATPGWQITYNAVFKSSAVPASGASQKASHSFVYDGTNWIQTGGPLLWL